jgi:hypothetical protein
MKRKCTLCVECRYSDWYKDGVYSFHCVLKGTVVVLFRVQLQVYNLHIVGFGILTRL